MDVTPFLELMTAPQVVFRWLDARREKPRFLLPQRDGTWSPVTWGAFADDIRAVASYLASGDLRPGDRAAVFAPNRVEWASAALAIQAAQGVMVPIYPASTAEQAAYVASHSDARVVFVDTPALLGRIFEAWDAYAHVVRIVTLDDSLDAAAVLAGLRAKGKSVPDDAVLAGRVLRWGEVRSRGAARDQESPGAFEQLLATVDFDAPGMMLYTSGTSGNPKGVPLSHRNVGTNTQDWLRNNAPLLPEAGVDVLWLPMSHIFGFGEMGLGNLLGFTTYMSDPATVLARLPELKPDVFMSVPAYWEKLATQAMAAPTPEAQREKLAAITGGRLRFCLSGGAGLKREIKEFFHEHGVLIIEGYGLTETSPTLTLNRPDAFRFDTVGKPMPSVELRLAEDGEILARGPNVFRGYHKDEAATREAFTDDGWFKTGDVGRWTEDGFLQIIDRKKDILVTAGGKNVPPANIELRFQGDPRFLHVVVYGDGKKFLVAGVWPNEAEVAARLGAERTAARDESLRALLAESVAKVNGQLASYESIKRFEVFHEPLTVNAGLLTASLKVRRKKVYEAFRAAFEALYAEPRA
jgi:long-chain acyl-CoA synthetase